MPYLVAGFLLNMDALDAFTCLANFINKPFNLAFYITDRHQVCMNRTEDGTETNILCQLDVQIYKSGRFDHIDSTAKSE